MPGHAALGLPKPHLRPVVQHSQDVLPRRRIAVAALNPHAGEGGLFGRQDIEVSEPVIAQCVAEGLDVVVPVPGDTVFVKLHAGQSAMPNGGIGRFVRPQLPEIIGGGLIGINL